MPESKFAESFGANASLVCDRSVARRAGRSWNSASCYLSSGDPWRGGLALTAPEMPCSDQHSESKASTSGGCDSAGDPCVSAAHAEPRHRSSARSRENHPRSAGASSVSSAAKSSYSSLAELRPAWRHEGLRGNWVKRSAESVGYQVRFEERIGPRTRLRFVTEGILTRRLLTDPTLKGVDAVVLDEFHERHLDSDLALALLKRLQHTRPEIRIIVMSATLDAAPIARYLQDCPVVRSEGRQYALSIRHLPYSAEPLHVQVRKALELLNAEQHPGNILAFLPGIAEIRRTMRECETIARQTGLLVLPLHGDLSPAEQDRAVLPSAERKLILATNVAESSVTVEGVTAVIDSGLARLATYSPWTGLPTLQVSRISKASAAQRAGRAGRTGPGQVLRLYLEEDYQLRPQHDTPEIARSDLSQLLLSLRAMKIANINDLDWLDIPPAEAVQDAELLLDQIGAKNGMEQRLARYPLSPRLSRILVEALDRGVGQDGCLAAAILGLGARSEKNDLLAAMDLPQDHRLRQHTDQLLRMARSTKGDSP